MVGIRFQSARQIIGFPKLRAYQRFNRSTRKFQSARQIIGFPKRTNRRFAELDTAVSICKADYWLPQGLCGKPAQER